MTGFSDIAGMICFPTMGVSEVWLVVSRMFSSQRVNVYHFIESAGFLAQCLGAQRAWSCPVLSRNV